MKNALHVSTNSEFTIHCHITPLLCLLTNIMSNWSFVPPILLLINTECMPFSWEKTSKTSFVGCTMEGRSRLSIQEILNWELFPRTLSILRFHHLCVRHRGGGFEVSFFIHLLCLHWTNWDDALQNNDALLWIRFGSQFNILLCFWIRLLRN